MWKIIFNPHPAQIRFFERECDSMLWMQNLTKEWNSELGFWKYSCGCIQYQDGYDHCPEHKNTGYLPLTLAKETKTKCPQQIN